MNTQVRIYRENPIAWWDKSVMRHLRDKYRKDKKRFVLIRSVYLALCEIESDFVDTPINFFTKTVGTYAGVSREVAGKYINLLVEEGLISKVRIKEPRTNKYLKGTIVHLLSLQGLRATSKPLSGYPSNGITQRRGTKAGIKNVSINKKLSNNYVDKDIEKSDDLVKINYYAGLLAEKLKDEKSISFYRIACATQHPDKLLQKAHEIIADGAARNPAAVFVSWFKTLSS